jgi:hypothetical protein
LAAKMSTAHADPRERAASKPRRRRRVRRTIAIAPVRR